MELTDAKSLTETQISKKLEEIRACPPAKKLRDVFEWIIKVPKIQPKLFAEVAATLGIILEQTEDVNILEKIILFFRDSLEKCEGACAEHFLYVSFMVHAHDNPALDSVASEILQKALEKSSESDEVSQVMSYLLKTSIVPKLKQMAEAKNYTSSFAVWRAVVRTTKLKISTPITNDVLQVATMAFKENNPEYHTLAFRSWKILIENLPPDVLRKPAYIRLILNPLNRTYRDTDANSVLQKYIAWWQHVVTLAEDAEQNFDDVVVPLLQRVFCMPSAKARQVNPTAFANPTRTIPQCAYTIWVFLWYDGDPELRKELQQLGHANFGINEHTFGVSCLAKHSGVLEDATSLIVNNIAQRVCPPPKDYPFLLCRVLLLRIRSFYENDLNDMVRLLLSAVYSILQTKLELEQTLRIFRVLAEKLPSRVMSSSQFNFRRGTFSMHECPLLTLTSFYIRHVAEISQAAGGESNRKKFRQGLKTLLDKGRNCMDALRLADHSMLSLQDADTFEVETWQEISAFLIEHIERTTSTGGKLEHDSGTISSALAFPMRGSFPLTTGVTKSWIELLRTNMKANALSEGLAPNQHLADICNCAHEQISKSVYDLNRLLLISQMMESLVKHCDLHSSSTPSDSTPTRRARKLGYFEPFVKCLIEIIRKGCEQLQNEKQPKAACQFYVNVMEMVHTLLRDSKTTDLCREFILKLVPELAPILKLTADKTTMRSSPLSHVESALLTAVDHVLYALKKKSSDLPKRDEVLLAVIRLVVKELANHWRASINETVQELGKAFSITPDKGAQLERSLLGSAEAQASTPVSSTKSRDSSVLRQRVDSQPERKLTRATSDVSALRNGSARDKGTPKPTSAPKRKSRTTPEEEFVPIISTKKKSEIFTEHQLEKLKEQKIIPSMYEDLSRSSQGTLMGPPPKPPETKPQAPDVKINFEPSTSNGSATSNGRPSTRESTRRSAAPSRKASSRKVRDSSSDDNLEFAFSANSHETSPENDMPSGRTAAKDQNRENKELKNEDSLLGSHSSGVTPGSTTASQEATSEGVTEPQPSTERAVDSSEKPRGALKRKLGRPTHSPLAAKLRPKRSSSSTDKKKSKRLQLKSDNGHSLGADNDSMADAHEKPDEAGDALKPKLSESALPTEEPVNNGNGTNFESTPVNTSTRILLIVKKKQESSTAKLGVLEKVDDDAQSSSPSEDRENSQQSLVNRIKGAVGVQREGVLRFVSSPEFLKSMSTDERRLFLGAFFKNVSDYIL